MTRMLVARLLVVLAAIFAVLSLLAGFIRYQALDNETFSESAAELIANDVIRDQIALALVEQLYANVDVAGSLEDRLPEDQQALAAPIAAVAREVADRAAIRVLERPRAQEAWVNSLSTTHEQLLRVLDDELTVVRTEGGVIVLNLRPLVIQLGDRIAIFGRVAERLPGDAGRIEIMEAQQLETAQDLTQLLKTLGRFLWLVPLALAALAIWLAGDRRRSIVRMLAFAAIATGLLVLVVRSVAGGYIVDSLVPTVSVQPAAAEAWDILTALLVDGGRTVLGIGVVLLAGVWLVGPSPRATAIRTRLAPWLERPEIAYGAAALALTLLVWWGPTAQTRRWQFVLALAVMLGLGVAALRRAAREADEPTPALPAPADPGG
ncbi:MAG TPA: hypothetical protein VNP93_07575 [Gaiellaceae bacterium]|nr:hypothetical protein [Gaiellaceae bacterium]